MTENPARQAPAEPIAIVGMACRFPDASGPAEFLELVLTGRRAFRRMPRARLDVSEYSDGEPGSPGPSGLGPGGLGPAAAFGSVRAALLEGWRFDRAAYGVTLGAYQAADPAHWLALETAARALADGGFPGGQGLTRDRTGVIIGNTLTGEVSRATALRTRWPYVRRVLRAALAAGEVSPDRHAEVIEHAAAGFLAPFPKIGDDTLAGSLPGAIADRICGHFGFRGGSHAVDAAHSSSLLAVAAACSALAAGDLDAAIAGGVDISLDPFELAGLAGTGVLAREEMRVFDARPTGFLPGEGCGLTVLMRAAEARAAGVPVYAEIAGWGVSSAGNPALTRPGSASLLLALRRAYHRAHVDPADVQLIEGDGTGTASGDLAELTSLAEIRQASPRLAALGSVKANIGHTKAAAGAAGLIKATLAIAAGIIPPATGCARPHPLIASEDARLRVPEAAEPWPERIRLAGVSSVGPGGASVHLILRRARDGRRRRAPGLPLLQASAASHDRAAATGTARAGGRGRAPGTESRTCDTPGRGTPAPPAAAVLAPAPQVEAFAISGPDRQALATELSRIAGLAPWLSDGELHDLACRYGRSTASRDSVRAGLVAGSQDQLAQAAGEALALLDGLPRGKLATAPGIAMADRGRGRVGLLFPGEGSAPPGSAHQAGGSGAAAPDAGLHPATVAVSLSALEWLAGLGVEAVAAAGHGLGEITGLVWAGCLAETDAARLVAQRAAVLAVPPAEQTAMVCVDTGGAEAEALCAGSDLVIAAYNGPRCHVLAGPVAAVRDLAQRLAEEGVPARLLDWPLALYSPAMADRVAPMRGVVREFAFRPPARRLISTITGTEVTAGDDLAAMLCTQLTSPVLFARALGQVAAKADLLIETGPGRQLATLAADHSDVPAFSLAAGRADENSTAQAAAALFASGAVPTLAPLFTARLARPIDIWRERVFIPSPCGAPAQDGDSTGAGRLTTDGDIPGFATPAAHRSPAASGRAPEAGAPGGAGRAPQTGQTTDGGLERGLPGRAAQAEHAGPAGRKAATPSEKQTANAGRDASDVPGRDASAERSTPGRLATDSDVPGRDAPAADAATGSRNSAGREIATPGEGQASDAGRAGRGGHTPGLTGWPDTDGGRAGRQATPRGGNLPSEETATGTRPGAPGEPGPPAPGHSRHPGPGAGRQAGRPGSPGASTPAHGTTAARPGEPSARGGPASAAAGDAATGNRAHHGGRAAPEPGADVAGAGAGRPARETAAGDQGSEGSRPAGSEASPGASAGAGQDPPGTAPWVRCFTEERRPAIPPEAPGTTVSWRVQAGGATAYGKNAGSAFVNDASADTVLAVLGDPAEPATCAALLGAAREAIHVGRLVVVAPGPGLTGLCASLHAEHPALGITLIRSQPGRQGLEAARRFATATPGRFREVVLDAAGAAAEPVMSATEPAADGTFPLGPADVVLLSGITRVGDLACATSLASRGAALAVIAPPGPEDPRMAALLTRLRSAGIRVSRKKADLTDPGQVAAAVRSLERGLGPVTAVVYAAASGPVEQCARLSEPTLRSFLGSQRGRFANVIRAVAMERVRVLVTFGSVAARYGRVGGACDALASGLLAEQAARLAEGWPRCRVLHLDWAPWAEPDYGDRQGGRPAAAPQPGLATPIPVEDGSRYLLSLLTTADMPARAAVHGRLGLPVPAALRPARAAPAARGRFGEIVRVHYPGVELVADTRLSIQADPYVADYRIDDLPMLPAAMVLEAMAQTASALAGRDLRHLADVRLAAPVLLLGRTGHEEAVIRVCAVRVGDTVETVLRCAETGFRLDHARAVFRPAGQPAAAPADWAAGPGRGAGGVAPGAMVDGTDLYGQVFFQSGRFRRVAFLPEASSRACRALVRGGDDLPWFGAVPGLVDAPLVLGSPGLNDATLHVLQACLPHRRLLPTGCESVTFSGREVRGALRVQAVRRPPAPGGAAGIWDIAAADATGQPVVTWQGVRLRDVGALAPAGPWHPALLAISLEARAAEFGLDPALRAMISCGTPPPGHGAEALGGAPEAGRPGTGRAGGPGTSTASPSAAGPGTAGSGAAGLSAAGPGTPGSSAAGSGAAGLSAAGSGAAGSRGTGLAGDGPAADDAGWVDSAEGTGPLEGFELRVRASRPVACRWHATGGRAGDAALLDEGLIAVRDQLAARLREPPTVLDARLAAMTSALAALGREPGAPLRAEDACDAGWILVWASDMAVACAVTRLSGVDSPVAVALACTLARPVAPAPGPAGPGGQGERLAANRPGPRSR